MFWIKIFSLKFFNLHQLNHLFTWPLVVRSYRIPGLEGKPPSGLTGASLHHGAGILALSYTRMNIIMLWKGISHISKYCKYWWYLQRTYEFNTGYQIKSQQVPIQCKKLCDYFDLKILNLIFRDLIVNVLKCVKTRGPICPVF